MNRKVLLVGVGISLPLLLVLGFAFRHDPQIVESPLVGKPAPGFRLADLDGNIVDLAELRGKPVIVNFWATYCVPCWAEHPLLLEGSRRWQGEIQFLGVIFQDDPDLIAQFNTEYGSWGPSLVDEGGRVAIAYGVYGPPETFFIDRDGVIVDKAIGAVSPEQLLNVANHMLEPSNSERSEASSGVEGHGEDGLGRSSEAAARRFGALAQPAAATG